MKKIQTERIRHPGRLRSHERIRPSPERIRLQPERIRLHLSVSGPFGVAVYAHPLNF